MEAFKLTQHAVMRLRQRSKKIKSKDNFDWYLFAKKQSDLAILTYVSSDGKTLYYELPDDDSLYFVVNAISKVCATIKPLSAKEKIHLEYPNSKGSRFYK